MDLKKHYDELLEHKNSLEASMIATIGALQFCEQLMKEEEAANKNNTDNNKPKKENGK